ncbi:MAG: hypothetical protein GY929_13280 [Actinomycetia bacterium]|nr:hypothetical protein [Actinomycetes bacterium]
MSKLTETLRPIGRVTLPTEALDQPTAIELDLAPICDQGSDPSTMRA